MGSPVFRRRVLAALGAAPAAAAASWLVPDALGSAKAADGVFRLSDAAWRARLGPARYDILRGEGTEMPFSSPLDGIFAAGTYHCGGCDLPVFPSTTKFDSQTGWPSFFKPLAGAVQVRSDSTLGMERTEVHCARCLSHLGHVFEDGPAPTGLRYCLNGLALRFAPASAQPGQAKG